MQMAVYGAQLAQHKLDSKWLVKVGKVAIRQKAMRSCGKATLAMPATSAMSATVGKLPSQVHLANGSFRLHMHALAMGPAQRLRTLCRDKELLIEC